MTISYLPKILISILILWGLNGCISYDEDFHLRNFPEGEVTGYVPIYLNEDENFGVTIEPPRPLIRPGKILLTGSYLLVNEINDGLHIINNEDPSNPKQVSFLRIPGNIDVAIKGSYLYADSYADLLAIEILSDSTVKEVDRKKNVFSTSLQTPPQSNSYFECPDDSKGVIIGWRKTKINNPKCYKP